MKFVVGIGNQERFRQVRVDAGQDYPYEIRLGGVAAVAEGCEAALLMFPLAAERYGGADPRRREAQLLLNNRVDGAPPLIVALPTLPLDEHLAPAVRDMSYKEWVAWAIESALATLHAELGDLTDISVLVHLEGAAMDKQPMDVLEVLRGVGAAW